MISAATEKQSEPTVLPPWLSIPIILLCLGGGGYVIHWYVMTDPLSHEAKILGDAPVQMQMPPQRNRPNGPPPNRRFVQERGEGHWRVHTDQATAEFQLDRARGKMLFRGASYNGNYSFVPPETADTILRTRVLVSNSARVAAMKLTPDQVKKLTALSVPRMAMNLSTAQRDVLCSLMTQYEQASPADRNTLAAKLELTLDQVAQAATAATAQQEADVAAQINAIITPDQWKQDGAAAATPSK
jgi:hypothetical protein